MYSHAQSNEWELTCNIGMGTSNFLDEKYDDHFKYKISSLLGLSIQRHSKIIGFRGSLYYMLNGAYNTRTRKDIHILNIGLSQSVLFAMNKDLTLLSIGLYENVLINRVFPSEYNGHPYEFNSWDIGFVLGLLQKIPKVCNIPLSLEFSFNKSMNSIYDNQHKVILTDGYSKWTRNIVLLFGVNLVIN